MKIEGKIVHDLLDLLFGVEAPIHRYNLGKNKIINFDILVFYGIRPLCCS